MAAQVTLAAFGVSPLFSSLKQGYVALNNFSLASSYLAYNSELVVSKST